MILLIYPLLGFKFSNAGTKLKTNNTPWKGDSHKPVKNPVDIFLIHHWAILFWGDQPLRDEIHNLRNFYEPFMNIHDIFMTGS